MFAKSIKEKTKWHDWFAFYPVKTISGKRCFFKTILRRGVFLSSIPNKITFEYQEKFSDAVFIKRKV